VSVRALLPVSIAGKPPADLVSAQVRADELPPGSHKLPVEITAPEHVTILEVIPKNITVEIGRLPRQ
jgi:hypothetical protein